MKKYHVLPGLLILVLIIIQSCMSPEAGETSHWRGPNRDGIYLETNLLKEWPENGPELLWTFEELGIGYASACVTDKKIYIAGTLDSIGFLFAMDHQGKLVWKTELGPDWTETYPGFRSTPTINDGQGYILDGLGILYSFNPEDGSILWSIDLFKDFDGLQTQHGMSENLLIEGDMLFCTPGGHEYNVVALDKKTGELIWKSKGNGEKSAYCSPILIERGGKKYLITLTAKSVISIDIEDGALAWQHDLEGIKYGVHANSPIYRDGYLLVSDGFEIGCFMLKLSEDGKTVEQVWKNELMDETNGHQVVLGDYIYGAAETKKKFISIDWYTGKIRYDIRDFSPGTVIAADGMLYCYSYNGEVGLVEPMEHGFEIRGSFKLPKERDIHISHPVIHDGILYIRYMNTLMAYDIRS